MSAVDWLFVYFIIAGIWVIANIGAACTYASYWRSQRESQQRYRRDEDAPESRRKFVRHLGYLGMSPVWIVPVLVWFGQWVAFAWRESTRAVHEEVIEAIEEKNKESKDLVIKGQCHHEYR
jgi:hypothetical protein